MGACCRKCRSNAREKAKQAQQEGFLALKVKVSHLSFTEANNLITSLELAHFVAVMSTAMSALEAITFFSQFPNETIE